jgi:hypothetical protein
MPITVVGRRHGSPTALARVRRLAVCQPFPHEHSVAPASVLFDPETLAGLSLACRLYVSVGLLADAEGDATFRISSRCFSAMY